MTIKYYCFRSTAEEGGVGSGLNGYVYFPTTIEAQVTQALVAGDIAYLATSEDQLVALTLDNNAVYADNLSEGLPTKLSSDSGWFGLANVASLERYEQGDISDTPAKKYIDQIKTLKGDTLSLRTKTSELENDSGFVTENQLATKQDKLTAGTNITISEDGTISATVTENGSVEIPLNMVTTDTEQTITSLKHFQGGIDLPINSEFMVANGTTVFKHNGSRLLMGATTDPLTIQSWTNPKINRNGIDYENIDSGNISEYVSIGSNSYELPTASTTTLGGVKVDGTTITIDENGVISSTATSNGESSGSNITGVYTEENLVAGEGIEIRDESSSGGIDEDTLLCLHFDNNVNDSSTYADSLNNSSLTLEYSQTTKFGDASCYSINGTIINNVFASVSDALTIDFWVNKNINENIAGTQISWGANGGFGFAAYGSGSQSQFYVSINNDYIYWPFDYDSSLLNDSWNHLAGVFSKNEEGYIVARLFVNGHKVLEETTPNTMFSPEGEDMSRINFITGGGIDEFRMSKKAVWTEDFTPNSSQYSADSGEQKKSINVDLSNVNLSGSNVNVTYTHDFEETTTDLNSFASSVDADLSNLTELVDNAITPETIGNYLPTNVVTGTGITQIVRITQSEYDALTVKDENTFYVIIGE